MCVSQQPELRWIPVGLWVLAACAGRSTGSKQGFATNKRPLAPCQGAFRFGRQGQAGQGSSGKGRAGRHQKRPGQAGTGQARAGRRAGRKGGRAAAKQAGLTPTQTAPVPGICQPKTRDPWGYPPNPRTDQKHANGRGFGVLIKNGLTSGIV